LSSIFTIGAIGAASKLAKNAFDSIANAASSVTSGKSTSFNEVLHADSASSGATSSGPSVHEIRNKLSSTIEELLSTMGIGLNPPIEFDVAADGTLQVSGDHERAAEIEANLSGDETVQKLVYDLMSKGSLADRHLVLHSISAA
jgi:hypothetical protein